MRRIDLKCTEFGIDRSILLRELTRKYIDEFVFKKDSDLVLQPIRLENFKIDGYSVGIEKDK